MRDFTIPVDLADLLSARRVIPFVGAGFSAAHGLPSWDPLLRHLADDVHAPIPYDEIEEACGGDPLQIAEYLYLVSGKTIGPLRHYLGRQLTAPAPFDLTGSHVELVNLGAAQVYTTNFDDLIEETYTKLGLGVQVVALPRDVATARDETPQIVKYHGDLRFEQTLVLTESQYYTRLDFESPMDLKFRSDLLGKSVLFMGYSFRDINIRIIWFKLMQMMKDVPDEDRLPSYIVRFVPNPVLDELYKAVGLTTIVIDSKGEAKSHDDQKSLFAQFLLALTLRISPTAQLPQQPDAMFVSRALIDAIQSDFESVDADSRQRYLPSIRVIPLLEQLARRRTPELLKTASRALYDILLLRPEVRRAGATYAWLAAAYARQFGSSRTLTFSLALSFVRPQLGRKTQFENLGQFDWTLVWKPVLVAEDVERLLDIFARDIDGHEDESAVDDDLAFGADIAIRIRERQLLAEPNETLEHRADELIDRASQIYPSVLRYEPSPDGPPRPDEVLREIEARVEELGISPADDDIPF